MNPESVKGLRSNSPTNFIRLFHHFLEDINLKTMVLFEDIEKVEPIFMKIITGKE